LALIINTAMSKTSVTSQKFSALEVVDSLKLDDELVFSDLIMSGDDLAITVASSLTMSSAGVLGVKVLSVGPVSVSAPAETVSILGGFQDGAANTDGSVMIGFDANGVSTPLVHSLYDSVTDEARLGFFGAVPVVQPTVATVAAGFTANASGILDDSATFGGYTMGQVVAALQAAGILA
jgi:hypothetical protein